LAFRYTDRQTDRQTSLAYNAQQLIRNSRCSLLPHFRTNLFECLCTIIILATLVFTVNCAVKSGNTNGSGSTTGTAPTVSYSGSPYNFAKNATITLITPTLGGDTPTSCASTPTLPVGLLIDGTTCSLSGTPTVLQGATAYTITATNGSGSSTVSISISISAVVVSYTGSPFTFIQNAAIMAITPILTGNTPTSCTSSPALPAGLLINATSCQITGTPTVPQTSVTYTITATNAFGNATANINIIVNYYFGGTVSGLTGTLILQNNGANALTLTANGVYQFANGLANGSAYKVTVKSQPTNQGCTIANSISTVSGLDVTNVNVTCATSGTEDTVNWNKTVTSTGIDNAKAIATDSMGNVYVVGSGTNLVNVTSGGDWWIKKYSPTGVENTVNWNKSFSSAGTNADSANAIAIDSANNVYVVGSGTNLVNVTSGQDWWMKKFSSTGVEDTVNWNKFYDFGGTTVIDIAWGVAVDSSNNVYVVGSSSGSSLIKKFSVNGLEDQINWNLIGGAKNYFKVKLDSSDNVYLVGSSFTNDYYITKFSSNGIEDTVNWNKSFNSSGTNIDQAYSIAIDSANNVYVAGYGKNLVSGTSGSADWWLKKFSSTGVEDTANWNKIFSSAGTNSDYANSIAIDSSDNIYVVGNGNNFAGATFQDWWLKKFNASGVEDTVNWNKMIDFLGLTDNANSITVGTGGDIYVAGDCSSTDSNWCIKKFAP